MSRSLSTSSGRSQFKRLRYRRLKIAMPAKIKPFFLCPILLFVLVSYSACEPDSTYSIKVNAVQNPEVEGLESYAVRSSDAEVEENDIWFKETEAYVKKALAVKGLYEAANPESADMFVDIAFGVRGPMIEIEEWEEPIYVQTDDGTEEITIMVNDGAGGQFPTTRKIYTNPEMKIVGYEKHVKPVTRFQKFLRITARVNHPKQDDDAPAYAWSVYVTSKDESDEVRKYLPVLAAAAVRYIGESTNEQVEIRLNGKDEVVALIKGGS